MNTVNRSEERRNERKQKRARQDRKILTIIAVLLILLVTVTTKSLAFSNEKEKVATIGKRVDVKEVSSPNASAPKKKVVQKTSKKETFYSKEIPMSYDQQEYLYQLTKKYHLDYKKTLAVIQHESLFDANSVNATHDYGLFQVNLVNHKTLAKTLHTPNTPFDPYVNMEWGTYMLSELYTYWSEKGYSGQTLDEVVWSSYNKGKTGFMKYGHATEYVYKMKASIETINQKF